MTFELEGWDSDLADIEEHYLAPRGTFAVLLDGDRVVGTSAALPRDAETCEIKRVYLLAEYRGQGHGRRLLGHVLGWAARSRHRRAVAWSDVRLTTAHQVYLRLGFTLIGERTIDDPDGSREYGFVLDLDRRPTEGDDGPNTRPR